MTNWVKCLSPRPYVLKKEENKLSPVLQHLVANMVHVEGGTFTMGATSEQGSDAFDWAKPAHRVTVSSFSIGKYEVTQEEWQAVMGSNPSNFKGAKRPVESVSWNECQDWYGGYSSGIQSNPSGPSSGSRRVSRGGGWFSYARDCRVSYRYYHTPDIRLIDLGLRLAL